MNVWSMDATIKFQSTAEPNRRAAIYNRIIKTVEWFYFDPLAFKRIDCMIVGVIL